MCFGGVSGLLTSDIEVLDLSLGSFVGYPLVVYNEMVSYRQLVVRVAAQQRVVYLYKTKPPKLVKWYK